MYELGLMIQLYLLSSQTLNNKVNPRNILTTNQPIYDVFDILAYPT